VSQAISKTKEGNRAIAEPIQYTIFFQLEKFITSFPRPRSNWQRYGRSRIVNRGSIRNSPSVAL